MFTQLVQPLLDQAQAQLFQHQFSPPIQHHVSALPMERHFFLVGDFIITIFTVIIFLLVFCIILLLVVL